MRNAYWILLGIFNFGILDFTCYLINAVLNSYSFSTDVLKYFWRTCLKINSFQLSSVQSLDRLDRQGNMTACFWSVVNGWNVENLNVHYWLFYIIVIAVDCVLSRTVICCPAFRPDTEPVQSTQCGNVCIWIFLCKLSCNLILGLLIRWCWK